MDKDADHWSFSANKVRNLQMMEQICRKHYTKLLENYKLRMVCVEHGRKPQNRVSREASDCVEVI